jgi:hypothetical protein
MRDAFKMQCEVFRSFMGIFMFLHTVGRLYGYDKSIVLPVLYRYNLTVYSRDNKEPSRAEHNGTNCKICRRQCHTRGNLEGLL